MTSELGAADACLFGLLGSDCVRTERHVPLTGPP